MARDRRHYWAGFDLGGTKMLATVYDDEFNPLGRKRKKTKAYLGMESGLSRIVETLEKAIGEANLERSDLAGIGMGSPGPLDLNRGVILETPNLGWSNAPLKKVLEEHFQVPVIVLNDVDAGVYGEYRFGAGKKARCVVGLFPGTGIGGGCVYEGKIIRGSVLSAMEIGHLPVQPDGPLCGCGRRGCLEAVASRLAIAAAAAVAAYRGEAPHLLEDAGMDLSNIRSGALAASVKAGDAKVEALIRDAARWLGVGVAGVVNLLAPEKVVLGGGLVEAIPELIVEEVAKSARLRVMPAFAESFKVVAAELGDDATVLGAAAYARNQAGTAGRPEKGHGQQ